MADDKENCVRITGAAAKRKASMADKEQVSKKRVVLGELPNMSNVSLPVNSAQTKNRRKAARVSKQKDTPVLEPNSDIDIDTRSDDPQMCAPYVSGIFDYLRQMEGEAKSRPGSKYIEKVQKDVTPTMREVLVDWLVEVSEEYINRFLRDSLPRRLLH